MDIYSFGIPNIKIDHVGPGRDPIEMVHAPVVLDAWDGYLVKRWENGRAITDGTIKLYFGCDTRSTFEDWQTEVETYHDLLRNQYETRDSIIRALTDKFDWFKEYYGLDPNDSPDVPDITAENKDGFDLKPFIGPQTLSFLEQTKDGVAYIEWHLNCTWDTEHGLSVITHKERVIDIDQGETDIWKVFADNGTYEEEMRAYDERAKNARPRKVKPWWKFWA